MIYGGEKSDRFRREVGGENHGARARKQISGAFLQIVAEMFPETSDLF